ncbi:dormancy-associated protein homolog 3-like isoform X1 [Salvia splendens]|uniref:dormancy-associated protein homolog 3-like isoform X1 n=1 Tax=Salvia splendens TaxID=180675 RepID=UPI001C255B96|nr:dormancy-associated protein homolog 3-like isoform X1 [Salvia splendens]
MLTFSLSMGLLDHLWDDTVAGPPPDTGLGKLTKHATFSFRSNSGKESEQVMDNRRSFGEDGVRVTRSIMIVKPPQGSQKDSPPVSPAGSTPPVSPFAGKAEEERKHSDSGGGQRRLLTRRQEVAGEPVALLLLTTCDIF